VLDLFQEWLTKHPELVITGPVLDRNAIFVTDGPWDIRDFIRKQCAHSEVAVPEYFSEWINIRKTLSHFYKKKKRLRVDLNGMLQRLGLRFEGRPHSGIDDARIFPQLTTGNIARICIKMLQDGHALVSNSNYETEIKCI
jgi:3'-5' exoribonuclease 1